MVTTFDQQTAYGMFETFEPLHRDTVADDLRQAAREIDRHGWTQGAMATESGRLCALGALAKVAGVLQRLVVHGYSSRWDGSMYRYHAMAQAFSAYLDRHRLTGCPESIPGWNDGLGPDITGDDIRVHLEKAAAEYEESHEFA